TTSKHRFIAAYTESGPAEFRPVRCSHIPTASDRATMAAETRKLTLEQAAEIIYQAKQPSPQQVGAVADLIARGALQGTRKGQWATTTDAVARYMATAT